jgi:catechol 2,3-dioxygenase
MNRGTSTQDAATTRLTAAVGHVALQTRDLAAAVAQATTIMGLRVSRQDDEGADLTCGAPRHELQLLRSDVDALDHIGLEAAGPAALAEVRRRLDRAGIPLVQDRPLDPALPEGFVFELPGRVTVELYTGMPHDQPDYVPTGVRPTRFGHVNVYVPDPEPTLRALVDVLDFRISDYIRGGAFTRCNPDHHGIAVLPGDNKLHHHAWEVASLGDLGRLGDVLDAAGSALVEGPVRHGIGRNLAAYFAGASGEAVEYYTDMERIHDDHAHVPGHWDVQGTQWYSRWVPRLPPDGFRDLGVPLAAFARTGATARPAKVTADAAS